MGGIMKVRSSAFVLLVLFVTCGAGVTQEKRNALPEQTEFSAEDESVKRPVPIPGDVLAILSQDELVRSVMENVESPPEKAPASWFSASYVHLANSGHNDLVVMGQGELRGANVITFWVFRSTGQGHVLVLTAPAHDLIVKKTQWKGLREIQMLAATAVQIHTVLFRFDGREYKVSREKWEPIP
jgi:hypothetical protein